MTNPSPPKPRYETLHFGIEGGIATITLHRPDRLNAYTPAMRDELLALFDETDANDDVRAVIVTGAGRAFCAGADLASGPLTFEASHSEREPPPDGAGRLTLRIFRSLKPVIAAINGPAVGVGATLTLAMDARLASSSARLGFVFARRGITPDGASSWFLPRLVGLPTALDWLYSGRLIEAQEALRTHLVGAVHEPGDLLPAARALAARLTQGTSPVSVALIRQLTWRMAGAPHPAEAHRAESAALAARGGSNDAREGVSSFLEKRLPVFPDTVSGDLPDIWRAAEGGCPW